MNTQPQDSKQRAPANPPGWAVQDDEISLIELFQILRRQWLWIAGFAVISGGVAFAVCSVIPKQYQASVLIQIGKVAGAGAGAGAGANTEVEAPQTLIERVNSDGFEERFRNTVDASFSLTAVPIKNTKLVRLEGRAKSPELARQGVEKSLEIIIDDHKFYRDEAAKLLSSSLRSTELELKAASAALDALNQRVIGMSPAKSDPVSALLLTQTQQQLNNHRATLAEKVATIQASINEQKVMKTSAVEPILAGRGAVYPKTPMVTLIAFLAGGFAGVLLAFLRNALQNHGR